jgi:hypothetical protein
LKETSVLNWQYVKDEVKYVVLHLNKGFLYSVKQLLTRPGDTVRDFLEGKRVNHYKPILLVFVLAGLNGFLSQYINCKGVMPEINNNPIAKELPKMMNWISSHYAVVELTLLPLYSLCSWFAFKKFGYNYIENIIINCFASSQRLILGLITIPILYLVDSEHLMVVSSLIALPIYGVTIWLYLQLYKKEVVGDVIVRLLLFGFLATVTFISMILISEIIYFFYLYQIGVLKFN